MDTFAKGIKNMVSGAAEYGYVLPIIGFFVIFVALAIPSNKTKEFAKNHWWSIIAGTMGVYGTMNFANWVWEKLTF